MQRPSLLLAALAAATVAAFWGVGTCGFVAYDDPSYVVRNPMVNQGLRGAAICWAFTAVHGANWHPVTSLSHLLDCSLFGLHAAAHHWVNLVWHVINVMLVFLVWKRFREAGGETRNADSTWAAALVAALFAIHPLHVESVAWISERKDVLSTALWLGTLLAYLRYAERSTPRQYALVLLGTVAALLAKPMAVTLPGTLLLLDFWPLQRWRSCGWRRLVWEKIPLFLLAAGLCAATLAAQRAEHAMDHGSDWGMGIRLGNAVVSCVRYLGKMLWPGALSPFYPHPGAWPIWAVTGAVLLLGGISLLAWRERLRRPWVAWGWAWYLGTLVPVLGLVQVGGQSIADRYTYVPLLGIFTMIAWAGAELAERRPGWRRPLAAAALLALAASGVRTAWQVPVWKDALRLAEQIRAVAGEHPIAYREMGVALAFAGRPEPEVNAQYWRGLEVLPDSAFFLNELALSAARAGRFDEALRLMERLRDTLPGEAGAWSNLGSVHLMAGNLDEAERVLRRAIALDPHEATARRLLAKVMVQQGRLSEARAELEVAVRADRWDWLAHNELGVVYFGLDRYSEGIARLEHALWINPRDAATRSNLATARERMQSGK